MRDYQQECIDIITNHFKKHDKQFIQLPTGAGKTWIFCEYLSKNSDKSLIICPSKELKEQIIQTCKIFNINSVSDNLKDDKKNHVITSSCLSYENSLNRIYKKNYDHIVIDECHHSQSKSYKNFLSKIPYKFKLLGCTATPERMDGKSLIEIFNELTYIKTIYELIYNGYLADIKGYRIKTNQNISKRAGDFRLLELKKLDNNSRNSIIYKTYIENCKDKKTIIFCLSIEHSIKIAEYLKSKGILADFIHGKMNKKIRQSIIKKYKNNDITVLTNCQLLTEGFDEPSIECIIIARPTASKALYCQMIGRGLRKTESKKICYLYELTDNNFKICTFNVLCGKESEFQREYYPGIKFTDLYKQLESIDIKDIILEKKVIELYLQDEVLKGNSISLLNTNLFNLNATEYQKEILKSYNILHYMHEINFIEAAFLIWKEKLKEKYYVKY